MKGRNHTNMKIARIAAAMIPSVGIIAACAQAETGRIVLQGNINGDPGEVIVVSYLPGHEMEYHYPEVQDGTFEFTMENVAGFADLTVSVGGVEFGARVNALDTLKMEFTINKAGEDVAVTYDGITEEESLIWKDFYEAYGRWSTYNIRMDSDPSISIEESIALLDKNDSTFMADHRDDPDTYYTHRASLAYGLLKAILLEFKSDRDGTDPYELPEYLELLDRVDPNDPEEVTFPLVYRWAIFHRMEFGDDPINASLGFIRQYGPTITNSKIRAMLAENMASSCMRDINIDSLEIYEPLLSELDRFVPDNPEITGKCRRQIESVIQSQPGKPVPEAVMETPDGQKVLLSSLFGKVLYVDVWATWCGPCVKEGPFFRALAEKYRNDDRICFISMSVDSDKGKWAGFVKEENPFWPQFILTAASNGEFCGKVGISTIPRFLLIDAQGRFIDADCERPSGDGIEAILKKALTQK